MNFQKSFTLSLLASCLAISGFQVSRADTETTQTTTTVTTNGATAAATVFNLSATGHYVVVDPLTGQIQGNYDPTSRLVEGGALKTGLVIVNETDGGPVGFVDASGNIVDVAVSAASPTLIVSIDSRRQDLNRRIDAALNKGVLTAIQAAAFRAELDRIAADEDRDRATGVISYRRALMLGYGLNTLSDRLIPLTDSTFQPVIAPQFVVVNGQLTLLDTINYRKHHLETRCDDEYAAGRLSAQQQSKLREELSKISITERRYVKHGALSTSKDQKLTEELDRLESNLNSDVAIINHKRSRIGIRAD